MLYICETKLTSLNGLKHCLKLRNLQVYGNRIASTAGIDQLKNLKTLGIADNRNSTFDFLIEITKVVGLPSSLSSLHLGNNSIKDIDARFFSGASLKYLNLGGNPIKSPLDILSLQNVPIDTLVFDDPLMKPTPITGIWNYQLLIVSMFSTLKVLDRLEVNDEIKMACWDFEEKKRW